MRWATGAELALVLAFGATLLVQANASAPPPPAPAPAAAPPSPEQVARAVAFAEQQAERVNGPAR